MKKYIALFYVSVLFCANVFAQIPKGELLHFSFDHSTIFPGTYREYWVYVPAQYKGDKPACLYVNQDGVQWNAPAVFDTLISRGEMPVTIGVFVTPGRVRAAAGAGAATARGRASDGAGALDRFNRSFEYDGLGDGYVRFLLEELLPDVEKRFASDGRALRLSRAGADRAIGGSSSGAICAWTAGWERPEAFSRVFSAIGTYVSLRGGDRYPGLIRKFEPKPLRVFLQDGSNDLNIYGGDWWKANESMERALTFAGYEVQHVWGEGGHDGKQGTAIFADAMRWLWKGWPAAPRAGASKNQMLADLLIPGEDWQLVGEGYGFTEGTAADAAGNVLYQDIPNGKTYFVKGGVGAPIDLGIDSRKASGTCFGPDGRRYVVTGTRQVIAYDATGKMSVIADSVSGNDIVVGNNGRIYITSPDGSDRPGKLYLIGLDGSKRVVDEGLRFPNGLTLTPDQTQLYVTESASHWVWLYTILPDGSLANKQRYGWLHVPDTREFAWPDGLRCDTAGRVYVTSFAGVQILDQAGRVNAILPMPGGVQPSNVAFGGAGFDVLYVSAGSRVYRRRLRTKGVNTFEKAYRPVTPRL